MSETNDAAKIEVKVQTLHQLFNSMDPSPFHERDLDHDAERFIVSWALEHPLRVPVKLVVHLEQKPDAVAAQQLVADSVHHYFAYQCELTGRDLRQLLREGWISLIIGLGFLMACVGIAQTLVPRAEGYRTFMREGLTILGWVAMWRPLDIYLYRWWPLRRLGKVYRKLSEMPVELRTPTN